MGRIHKGIESVVGNTPLVEVSRYAKNAGCKSKILVKLEYLNPAGSIKDRVALAMVEDAEKRGELNPGGVIIEPTSGNTGIGLASIAAVRGYRVILTMPCNMSTERRQLLSAYGAELVLTDAALGMDGAIQKAKELVSCTKGAFMPSQFTNEINPKIHYKTTGREIWIDTKGQVDILVAGVGTGGTITGVGKFLKEKNPAAEIFAVEPFDSPVLSGGERGAHDLQGIGAGFVPKVLDTKIYDKAIAVKADDAYCALMSLVRTEGFFVGISSGAALFAATQIAKKPENAEKNIVVILADGGERYLSTGLFNKT